MGAGHYTFQKHSQSELPYSAYFIDQSVQSYEDMRDDALKTAKEYFSRHPDQLKAILPTVDVEDLDFSTLCDVAGEDLLNEMDVLHASVDAQTFYEDQSSDQEAVINSLVADRVEREGLGESFSGVREARSNVSGMQRDDFTVIARGRFFDVGVRGWEHYTYVGVVPNEKIVNHEEEIAGNYYDFISNRMVGYNSESFLKYQQLFARIALACPEFADPKNAELRSEFDRVAGDFKPAVIDLDAVFPESWPQSSRTHDRVWECLLVQSRVVQSVDAEWSTARFQQALGVSAEEVQDDVQIVEHLAHLWDELGALPETINHAMKEGFKKIDDCVREGLCDVSNDVGISEGGWTSAGRVVRPSTLAALAEKEKSEAAAAPVMADEGPAP